MSETTTHTRGEEQVLHPITGEPPGIKEILERRTSGELAGDPLADAPDRDDAATAAEELAAWRTRATDAERRATEADHARQVAEQQRFTAMRATEDTGFTAITTALAATQQSIETLQADMKTAGEAGDFGKVGEIATKLGQLGSEARELERGKNEYERTRTQRLNAPPTAPAIAASSPAERTILSRLGASSRDAFLSTRTPQTAEFLRAHPEFFTDDAAFNRISGADTLAKGRGIAIDTPEYFRLIEKEAALTSPTRQPGRPVAPSAAPSRDAPGPSGTPRTRAGDIYVSADQKAAASWMGVDPAEYAMQEAELRQRGELPYRRR